jgi:hypothetical protein
MLGRALSLATVTLLTGWFATVPARAQNLEAGKSPSQIFAGTCNACHKSPRGLLKTVSPGSLPGFLRQHYTTSSDMASLLSAFLVSSGATDTRLGGSPSKPGVDAKSGGSEQLDRQGRRVRPGSQEAAKPDTDGLSSQGEPGRQGRKRLARPGEGPDETKPAVDGQAPVRAGERGPDDRKLTAKQRLSKRGRPVGEESPKSDTAKSDAAKSDAAKSETDKSDAAKSETAKPETAKPDAAKSDTAKDTAKTDVGKDESPRGEPAKDDKPKSETAKEDSGKPEGIKPASEGKSEAAKIEAPKDRGGGTTPVLRADPVPPVTPAPPASAAMPAAAEPAARPSAPAMPEPSPPAVTASAPPPAPAGNAGPPAPPISQ